jgi:peptidoglycan/xylan/chitin deacetylase (PgdA/CDA1 family)
LSGPLILHYHALGDIPRRWDRDNLVIEPDRLLAQLRAVRRLGYRFVALSDLVSALKQGRGRDRVCAVTFDDGTVDNLTILPPLLRTAGAPATVYVCPGLAGEPHPSIAPEAGVRLMDASELRALAETDGFELGSHTLRHTSLAGADHDEALTEMASSKAALEDLIHRPVLAFAYPGCAYSPACPRAARDAGYQSAVTCARHGGRDPFELRRASPDRLDGRLSFWLKARQVYDPIWESAPGRVVRRVVRDARHLQA